MIWNILESLDNEECPPASAVSLTLIFSLIDWEMESLLATVSIDSIFRLWSSSSFISLLSCTCGHDEFPVEKDSLQLFGSSEADERRPNLLDKSFPESEDKRSIILKIKIN